MDMAINVGETLKKLRLERGLTLKEISQALHFSVSVLSEYEKGITTPSVERLLALMDFMLLKLSMHSLKMKSL